MKIDFSAVIRDLKGDILKVENASKAVHNMTLLDVTTAALLAPFEDERSLEGTEKAKRFTLAMKVSAATAPLELQTEDIALIKRLIGKMWGALVVGRAYELIEGSNKE